MNPGNVLFLDLYTGKECLICEKKKFTNNAYSFLNVCHSMWQLISCQLNRIVRYTDMWLNITLGCVLRMFMNEISIWISRLMKRVAIWKWENITQSKSRAWTTIKQNKNKKTNKSREKKNFLSPQLLAKISFLPSCLHIHIQAGIFMISISSSQALRLRLNYTTDFPMIPAFRQQMVKFLSLPNCMSFFLI